MCEKLWIFKKNARQDAPILLEEKKTRKKKKKQKPKRTNHLCWIH